MTDTEKFDKVNRIIANLIKKYSHDDVKDILTAAWIKINTVPPEELLEEFDDLLIDESDLPF